MTNVIGVRFKDGGKVYYFDPCDTEVVLDQYVIVETARGIECGQVSSPNHEVEDSEIIKPLKKMLRDDAHLAHNVIVFFYGFGAGVMPLACVTT